MKITICQTLLIICICFFTDKTYCQDVVKEEKKNIEISTDYNFDKLFKASSSKYAIENQINEIKEMIKEKQKENEFLENISLENIDSFHQNQTSIDKEWKSIQESLASSSTNYRALVDRVNLLIQRFYPLVIRQYFSDNSQPLIITKINQTFNQQIQSIRDQLNIVYLPYKSPDYNYTKADVEALLSYSLIISDSTYKKFQTLYSKMIEDQKVYVKQKIDERKSFIDKAYNKIEELNKVSEEKDISINQKAITIGLPWFCVTVIILFGFTFFYKKIYSNANANANNANANDENSMSKVLLEVITVLLITLTVLILGLARIITENVLGTLLGGIAGYILNRNKK